MYCDSENVIINKNVAITGLILRQYDDKQVISLLVFLGKALLKYQKLLEKLERRCRRMLQTEYESALL